MRIAAKSLERRAAELEIERNENHARDKAKRQSRQDRKLVPPNRKSSLNEDAAKAAREKEMLLLRWSSSDFGTGSAIERGSSLDKTSSPQRLGSTNRFAKSDSSLRNDNSNRGGRPHLAPQFSVGRVAQVTDIEAPASRGDYLIKIGRLREGDPVWVKRSNNVWSYAILKTKLNGPDASLEFIVNERGATKKFPVTHLTKYVRLLAEIPETATNSEEDEIDIMISDLKLDSSGGDRVKKSRGGVLGGDKEEDKIEMMISGPRIVGSSDREKGRKKERKKIREEALEGDSDRQRAISSMKTGRRTKAKGRENEEHETSASCTVPSNSSPAPTHRGKKESRRALPSEELNTSDTNIVSADTAPSKSTPSVQTNQEKRVRRGSTGSVASKVTRLRHALPCEKLYKSATNIVSADTAPSKNTPSVQTNQEKMERRGSNGSVSSKGTRFSTSSQEKGSCNDPPSSKTDQEKQRRTGSTNSLSPECSPSPQKNKEKLGRTGPIFRQPATQNFNVSMYTFWDGEDIPTGHAIEWQPHDESSQDESSQKDSRDGNSQHSIINSGPPAEDDHKKHPVLLEIPQCQLCTASDASPNKSNANNKSTGEKGASNASELQDNFQRSVSLPNPVETSEQKKGKETSTRRGPRGPPGQDQVQTLASSLVDFSANNISAGRKESFDGSAFREMFRLSVALPVAGSKRKEAKKAPIRKEPQRVSWNDEVDQIKEEIAAGSKQCGKQRPAVSSQYISKKKLKDLDMGETIRKHHVMQKKKGDSFHSALRMMHDRRSSVMMPSTSGVRSKSA